jgi:hypothetical protein
VVVIRGIPEDPPDIKPVPTARELIPMGLARAVERNSKGEPTIVSIDPAGQQLIHDIMQRNAKRRREHAAQRPSDTDP